MCAQCMVTAATAAGAATGARSWLATRSWVTPVVLRRATAAVLMLALLAAGLVA